MLDSIFQEKCNNLTIFLSNFEIENSRKRANEEVIHVILPCFQFLLFSFGKKGISERGVTFSYTSPPKCIHIMVWWHGMWHIAWHHDHLTQAGAWHPGLPWHVTGDLRTGNLVIGQKMKLNSSSSTSLTHTSHDWEQIVALVRSWVVCVFLVWK